MRDLKPIGNMLWAVLFCFAATFGFNGCGDVNDVVSTTPPPAQPGPLTILTSSPLPAGTTTVFYDITLAPSGGTPPYTWSLAPGSPTLPDGLVLAASTGKISGTPTTTGTTPTEFKLKDSTGKSVQKVLSIKVNASPTPLAILTNSLTPGTINQPYAFALGGTGGTTPYTWGLKDGSPPLPNGLTLDKDDGGIRGTPTVTSNDTHIFTLTDATSLTVEKSLQLSINAIPLSITTNSPLPQGTANQSYSETLEATGGTGAYTWGLTVGSPALPTGLTLNTSTGLISGIPTDTSSLSHTFTVTDQTPPTPQTATKTLQLIIGDAPPQLVIQTPSPLPNGVLNQPYSQTVQATGGSGTRNWSFLGGNIPNLSINSSTGVISGNPTPTGQFTFTVQVTDALFTDTKDFTITITAPPPPTITTPSPLPTGTVNVPYPATTLTATGGAPPLTWDPVVTPALPNGLTFNAATATITGTPLASSLPTNHTFTVRDSTVPFNQTGTKQLSLTINAALTIDTLSPLPAGTVGQPYTPVQLVASGGAPPYTWSIIGTGAPSTAAPGLTLSSGGVIGGGGQTPTTADSFMRTYRVQDDNGVAVTKSLTLNVNAALTIDNISPLPNGTAGQLYTPGAPLTTMTASGGTPPYSNWSVTPALPTGLFLDDSTGAITGTPVPLITVGTTIHTFSVQDSTNLSASKPNMSLTIDP